MANSKKTKSTTKSAVAKSNSTVSKKKNVTSSTVKTKKNVSDSKKKITKPVTKKETEAKKVTKPVVKKEKDIKKKNNDISKVNDVKETKIVTKQKKQVEEKVNDNSDVIVTKKKLFNFKKKKDKKKNEKNKVLTFFTNIKNNVVSKFNKKKINTKTSDKNKKNSKKNKSKKPLLAKKDKKLIITFAIICSLIILVEGIYVVVKLVEKDRNTIYYDSLNSLVIDNTDIVAVGSSNFRYSKKYNYTKGLEKGKLIKYDKKGKLLFEVMYDKAINNTFSSIISVEDGYIVVGSGVFSEEEQLNGAREAFIIKFTKKGKIVWEKFHQVLSDTKFNKVIETSDGYVVIGQSIYANMEMGNHTTGGGIIVKYDKEGNEVWRNNHGGTKSGNFNDIVEVNGNFYVVGKDGADSGNIVKFNSNGKYEWHKNYSYTDGIGLTGIAYLNNSLYVVGSKKVLPQDVKPEDDRSTTNTDSLLVVYNLDGTKKFEKTFGGSNFERYNSILSYNNNLYVIGHTSSKDAGLKVKTDGKLMTGLVVRYDENGNILKKETYGGSNNDNLTDIVTDGICLYISGYSNSKDGNIITSKNNGKDYFGKVVKLDLKFRIQLKK